MKTLKVKVMKRSAAPKVDHRCSRVNSVIDVRHARPGDLVFPGRDGQPRVPIHVWLILGIVPGQGKSPDNDALIYWEFSRTRGGAVSGRLMSTEFKWIITTNYDRSYPLYVFGEVS